MDKDSLVDSGLGEAPAAVQSDVHHSPAQILVPRDQVHSVTQLCTQHQQEMSLVHFCQTFDGQ